MADPQTVQSLLAGRAITAAGSTSGAVDPSKVKELATQFEAMLLSQMLKGMQTAMMDGEESTDGFKAGPLGDVMTQELGLALSRAGGFGLGSMLNGAMSRMPGIAAQSPTEAEPSATPDILNTPLTPMPRVSSAYGWRNDPIDGGTKFHKGIDLPMPTGSEVRSPADGRVVSVGEQAGYGLTVVVAHGNGLESRYAHLSGTDIRPGDPVRAGDLIARSGNTGRSTGPHLHFEVTVNGQAVDPVSWAGAVASRPAAIGQ
jgi:murein DD-endopeptidase MepM/ murein hydrolase activator NlpD